MNALSNSAARMLAHGMAAQAADDPLRQAEFLAEVLTQAVGALLIIEGGRATAERLYPMADALVGVGS